jgi:putative membrane protein
MKNINDVLANDRTFLAWLRTGIAMFGLGFVVSKISYLIDPQTDGIANRGAYTIVGVCIVLSGAGIVLIGLWQHHAVAAIVGREDDEPRPRWPLIITTMFVVGAIVLSVLIVVSH